MAIKIQAIQLLGKYELKCIMQPVTSIYKVLRVDMDSLLLTHKKVTRVGLTDNLIPAHLQAANPPLQYGSARFHSSGSQRAGEPLI